MGFKRIKAMAYLLLCRNGESKANYLRKTGLFKCIGKKVFWYPRILPAEPHRVEIHNNVSVATDVYFCTHDISHDVLNNCENIAVKGGYLWKTGNIVLNDNVFVGAKSIIKYGVTIGPNAIVAMGSVVVKDVPPNTIVGGNPAKSIGTFSGFANKLADEQGLEIVWTESEKIDGVINQA